MECSASASSGITIVGRGSFTNYVTRPLAGEEEQNIGCDVLRPSFSLCPTLQFGDAGEYAGSRENLQYVEPKPTIVPILNW